MFYGWLIVALAFVAQFVVMGAFIQCYPVFLLPLAEEFGIGRAEAALPPAAILICGVVVAPIVGRLVAAYPIRNIMLAGALTMAVGFAALSQVTRFWQYLLVIGVSGSIALGALGAISCNSLVVNWFERKRSMALGIAMIGMSISGAVMIPIATLSVETWGWRRVHLGLAVIALALIPLVAGVVVTRPSDRGLMPDGDEIPPESPDASRAHPTAGAGTRAGEAVEPPLGTRTLLRRHSLWLIAAACGLVFFGATGIMNHGLAFAIDRGIEPLRAAALLSAISVGAAVGKLAFGWLSDQLGERGAFGISILCDLAALAGLLLLTSFAQLVAAAALFGLGIGGVAPLQAALLAREFGARDFAPVMGLIGPLMIPFQISGPPLAGYLFDRQGSYDVAIWIFLGATVVSGMLMAGLPAPAARGVEEAGEPPSGAAMQASGHEEGKREPSPGTA